MPYSTVPFPRASQAIWSHSIHTENEEINNQVPDYFSGHSERKELILGWHGQMLKMDTI